MTTTLYVTEGRVNCPRRGDIDVDTCICCPELSDIADEQGEVVVKCTGKSRWAADPLATGWYGVIARTR